jgi:hypothetical protein
MDEQEFKINITQSGTSLLKENDKNVFSSNKKVNTLSALEAFHLNALLDKLSEE